MTNIQTSAFPVADDPVDLLLRHEVCKVPDHLSVQDALPPQLVEGGKVHGHQLRLELLGEDEGRVLVQIEMISFIVELQHTTKHS